VAGQEEEKEKKNKQFDHYERCPNCSEDATT